MMHTNRLQRIFVSNMGIASRVLGTDMPCTQNPCWSLFSLHIVRHISCYVIKSAKLSTQTGREFKRMQ